MHTFHPAIARGPAWRRAIVTLAVGAIMLAATMRASVAAAPDSAVGSGPCEPPAAADSAQAQAVNIHLEIRLADGRMVKVRGMRAPRGARDWPDLPETARQALAGWIDGRAIRVSVSTGEPDRWGRVLADVFAADTGQPAAMVSVAATMIAAGWALADPTSGGLECLPILYGREATARAERLGLWSDPHFRVRDAGSADDLRPMAGEFAIIEGVVRGQRSWRSVTFLNFGERSRVSPSISLSRRAVRAFERAGAAPATFHGKRIRVRGVLQVRRVPVLAIDGPHAVELLEPAKR